MEKSLSILILQILPTSIPIGKKLFQDLVSPTTLFEKPLRMKEKICGISMDSKSDLKKMIIFHKEGRKVQDGKQILMLYKTSVHPSYLPQYYNIFLFRGEEFYLWIMRLNVYLSKPELAVNQAR